MRFRDLALIATVSIALLTACASFPYYAETRVSAGENGMGYRLECLNSSSGKCHFRIAKVGAAKPEFYAVQVGGSQVLDSSALGASVCFNASDAIWLLCRRNQTLGSHGSLISVAE